MVDGGNIDIVDNTVKYTLSYDVYGYFSLENNPPTEAEAGETITLNFSVSMTDIAFLEINGGEMVEVLCTPLSDVPEDILGCICVGSYTFTMPAQNTTIICCSGGGGSND